MKQFSMLSVPAMALLSTLLLLLCIRYVDISDAIPVGCDSNTVGIPTTVTFDTTETVYSYTIYNCIFNADLTLEATNTNEMVSVTILMDIINIAGAFTISSGMVLGTGSSITTTNTNVVGTVVMGSTYTNAALGHFELITPSTLVFTGYILLGCTVVFQNLQAGTAGTGNGIYFSNSAGSIDNAVLHFKNVLCAGVTGLRMEMTASSFTNAKLIFEDTNFTGTSNSLLKIVARTGDVVEFRRCRFATGATTGNAMALEMNAGSRVYMEDTNRVVGGNIAIQFRGISTGHYIMLNNVQPARIYMPYLSTDVELTNTTIGVTGSSITTSNGFQFTAKSFTESTFFVSDTTSLSTIIINIGAVVDSTIQLLRTTVPILMLTASQCLNTSMIGVSESTISGMYTLLSPLTQSSTVFINSTTATALAFTGNHYASATVIDNVTFSNPSGAAILMSTTSVCQDSTLNVSRSSFSSNSVYTVMIERSSPTCSQSFESVKIANTYTTVVSSGSVPKQGALCFVDFGYVGAVGELRMHDVSLAVALDVAYSLYAVVGYQISQDNVRVQKGIVVISMIHDFADNNNAKYQAQLNRISLQDSNFYSFALLRAVNWYTYNEAISMNNVILALDMLLNVGFSSGTQVGIQSSTFRSLLMDDGSAANGFALTVQNTTSTGNVRIGASIVNYVWDAVILITGCTLAEVSIFAMTRTFFTLSSSTISTSLSFTPTYSVLGLDTTSVVVRDVVIASSTPAEILVKMTSYPADSRSSILFENVQMLATGSGSPAFSMTGSIIQCSMTVENCTLVGSDALRTLSKFTGSGRLTVRNSKFTAVTGGFTLSAVLDQGGVFDHDGSNVHQGGSFSVTELNDGITPLPQHPALTLNNSHQLEAVTITLSSCEAVTLSNLTITAAVLLNFSAISYACVAIERVVVSGPFTVEGTFNYTGFEITTSSLTNSITFHNGALYSSRVLLSNTLVNGSIIFDSIGLSDNSTLDLVSTTVDSPSAIALQFTNSPLSALSRVTVSSGSYLRGTSAVSISANQLQGVGSLFFSRSSTFVALSSPNTIVLDGVSGYVDIDGSNTYIGGTLSTTAASPPVPGLPPLYNRFPSSCLPNVSFDAAATTTTTTTTTTSTTTTTTPGATTSAPSGPCSMPILPSYFGTGLRASRYVNYNLPATVLSSATSGLSCLFTSSCTSYFGARYLVTSTLDTMQSFILDSRGVGGGSQVRIVHALSKGTAQTVRIDGGGGTTAATTCEATFKPFTCAGTPSLFDSIPMTNPNVSCRTLLGCTSDAARTTNALVLAAEMASVSVTGGRVTSSCGTGAVLLSGVVTSSLPFYSGAVYGYGAVQAGSGSDISASMLPSTLLSTQWVGSSSPTLTSPRNATNTVFVGSTSSDLLRPAPLFVQRFGVVYPANDVNVKGTEPLTINASTTSMVVCSVGDTRSYPTTFLPGGAPTTPLLHGTPTNCYTYDTVDDLHLACSQQGSCVGFTTVRVDGPTAYELPHCMFISGTATASSLPYDRIYYQKPTTALPPTCRTVVGQSGRVAVYIMQSSFKQNTVIVRVDGDIIVCGGTSGFRNGFAGLDGRCDVMALCFSGAVRAGAVVEVTPSSRLPSNGCNWSLRSIVQQTSIDTIQVTTPAPSPPAQVNTTGYVGRVVSATYSETILDASSTYPIFVYGAQRAALSVSQTGYSCEVYTQQSGRPCPTHSVSISTPTSCAQCGGEAGFYPLGINNGSSDKCSSSLFCGNDMPLLVPGGAAPQVADICQFSSTVVGEPFTGIIRVKSLHTQQASRTTLCSSFNATLFTTQSPDSSVSILSPPLYPLVLEGTSSTGFRVLPAALSSLGEVQAAIQAANSSGMGSSSSPLVFLGLVGPPSSTYRMYYAPPPFQLLASSQLSANSSYVCMVDHAAGGTATCTFTIPATATHVQVSVSQTDFASMDSTLDLSISTVEGIRSMQCGGTRGFSGKVGQQEKCDQFATCLSQNIFANTNTAIASTIALGTNSTLTITIPPQITAYNCDYAVAIIVDFTAPFVTTPYTCDRVSCPYENTCVDESDFCNGIQNCNSGADEELCSDWIPLTLGERFCVDSSQMQTFSNLNARQCRTKAAVLGSSAFTIGLGSGGGGMCTVYAKGSISTIFAAPSDVICFNTSVQTYVRLPTDTSIYTRCTSSVHCGSNGVIGNVNPKDGDTCICSCAAGFTGSSCSEQLQLETIKYIVASFSMNASSALVSIAHSQVASALRMGSRRITSECLTSLPSIRDGNTVLVECTVTSLAGIPSEANTHKRLLLAPSSLITINNALYRAGHPLISTISTSGVMTALTLQTDCSSVGTCLSDAVFTRLRVQVRNATGITSMVVSTTTTAAAGARSERRIITCTPVVQDGDAGCMSSTCEADIGGQANTTLTVSDIQYMDPTALTGICDNSAIDLSQRSESGNVETDTTAGVETFFGDFSRYIIGAGLTFVAGVVFGLVGFVCICVHRRRQSTHVTQYDDYYTGESEVENYKIGLLSRLEFRQITAQQKCVSCDRCGVITASFAVIVCVLGAFLTIYYVTAESRDSTFSVMYEEYPDSLCEQSASSTMPTRIFSIPTTAVICTKQSITGEAAGAVYAVGYCEGSSGIYRAKLKVGSSFSNCESSQELTLASGSCIPLTRLSPTSTRSSYVRLRCSKASLIANRTATLAALTAVDDQYITLNVDAVPDTLASSVTDTHYIQPYVSGSTVGLSTSTKPETYASTANDATFDGTYDSSRLVLQDVSRSYTTSTSTTAFEAEESQYKPLMGNLSSYSQLIAPLTPQMGDYPVGYVFGGFGTGSETTWSGAGIGAQRYYGIEGTQVDVGAVIPPEDDAGHTVSFFMRATDSTRGFAFATTDALENTQTLQIYALDRLAQMIENGKPDSAWYNQSVRVYSSLFVDGPGRTLTYATADPNRHLGDRVELLEWNLDYIHTSWLLNGLWHHVAVVLKRENGKLRARLILDGETSESVDGWVVCVDQPPTPIHHHDTTGHGFNVLQDRLHAGGLLVVGYMNGGVYHLTATNTPLTSSDILYEGSDAMRAHNAFPRIKTLGLGAVMIVLASIGLIYCIFTGYQALWGNARLEEAVENKRRMVQFLHHVATVRESIQSSCDEALEPIRYSTALRWTGLLPSEFSSLLIELEDQVETGSCPSQIVLDAVLRAHIGPGSLFSIVSWNNAIHADMLLKENATNDATEDSRLVPSQPTFFADWRRALEGNNSDEDDTVENSRARTIKRKRKDSIAANNADVYVGEKDDAEAGVDGLMEIQNISLGGGGGGGGGASVLATLGPLVTVFQTLGVWSGSLSMPTEFLAVIGTVASFITVDLGVVFTGLDTIVVPLIELFLGLCAMVFLVYVLVEDEHFFETNLCNYVVKRDELEMVPASTTEEEGDSTKAAASRKNNNALPFELQTVTKDDREEDDQLSVDVLSLPACLAIDALIKSHSNETLPIATGGRKWSVHNTPSGPTCMDAAADVSDTRALQHVGRCCQRHPTVPLVPTPQNEIYPYSHAVTCCVSLGGKPCGSSTGLLYRCGAQLQEGEKMCMYAVCEKHIRQTVFQQTLSSIRSVMRKYRQNGPAWMFALLVMTLVGFLYTPIVKTAIMILVCHPMYQCEFGMCYTFITQKFAVAVFLSGTVALLLGLGLPVLLLISLNIRKRKLDTLFFAAEYGNNYSKQKGGIFGDKHVSVAEWSRYIATDDSVLQKHYGASEYHWLYLPALYILFKVFVIIPIVLLEIGSFEQRLGASVVEIVIAAFAFFTTPVTSPVVLLALRVASVHQMLQLGLQSIDLVTQFDKNLSLGYVMVAVTVIYVLFSIVVIVAMLLAPLVVSRIGVRRVRALLARIHLASCKGASLWISSVTTTPAAAAAAAHTTVTEGGDVDAQSVTTFLFSPLVSHTLHVPSESHYFTGGVEGEEMMAVVGENASGTLPAYDYIFDAQHHSGEDVTHFTPATSPVHSRRSSDSFGAPRETRSERGLSVYSGNGEGSATRPISRRVSVTFQHIGELNESALIEE